MRRAVLAPYGAIFFAGILPHDETDTTLTHETLALTAVDHARGRVVHHPMR
jgi:hypothetical protein